MSEPRWRIAGMCFDHMHIGDQLANAIALPDAELVGVFDTSPERMATVCADLQIGPELRYTDWRRCLEHARPDVVVVCSPTAEHGLWAERAFAHGSHVMLEKPFASALEDADRMIAAAQAAERTLAINWPLAWYPVHRTTRRLIAEGTIGEVLEVHYYDGNRGPLRHEHDKHEIDAETARSRQAESWWYRKDLGGGSMLDYLGYGVTLATWFRSGEAPEEVTASHHVPPGMEVDEQSVVVARYRSGLSTFQTRWGTFSDPWRQQPQPRCGFVVVGARGTIASHDHQPSVVVQDERRPRGFEVPVDEFAPADRMALAHLLSRLELGEPVAGPTGWEISRTGQRIVDAAVRSAETRQAVRLDMAGGQ